MENSKRIEKLATEGTGRQVIRLLRYNVRTEKSYWIRYIIRFQGIRHPSSNGAREVPGNESPPPTP